MKKLLIIPLLLFASLCRGQVVDLKNIYAYRGNSLRYAVDIPIGDTASYSVKLYYSRIGRALPPGLQPSITQSPGLVEVVIGNTNPLPALSWLEIKRDGATKFFGQVYTDKRATPPGQNSDLYATLWKQLMNYNY